MPQAALAGGGKDGKQRNSGGSGARDIPGQKESDVDEDEDWRRPSDSTLFAWGDAFWMRRPEEWDLEWSWTPGPPTPENDQDADSEVRVSRTFLGHDPKVAIFLGCHGLACMAAPGPDWTRMMHAQNHAMHDRKLHPLPDLPIRRCCRCSKLMRMRTKVHLKGAFYGPRSLPC